MQTIATGRVPVCVSWSPNGQYIAVVNYGDGTLQTFNASNPTAPIANPAVSTGSGSVSGPTYVSWSPNGQYIAVVNFTDGTLQTFNAFNPAAPVANPAVPPLGSNGNLNSLSWSPNGQYIAVVDDENPGNLSIFNVSNPAVPIPNTPVATGNSPTQVRWSPNGQYIAVVNYGNGTLQTFNASNPAAPIPNTAVLTGNSPNSLSWSPNGQYIAVVNYGDGTLQTFNASNPTAPIANPAVSTGTGSGSGPFSVSWSPDGQYIAVVNSGIGNGTLQTFNALQFPSNNVIKDNIVWCNNGGSSSLKQPNGVGISGSNIANLIINNTSYCNNSMNYQFVTTPAIFNSNFDWMPTQLQNISITCGQPMPQAFNLQQQLDLINSQLGLLNIVNNQITDLTTQISTNTFNQSLIDRQLVTMISETEYIAANIPYQCASISISSSATISSAGIYCLANDISGNIAINSSNVTFDLSNHTITSTAANAINVAANLNRISIANGRVIATNNDGVKINSGDEQVTIRHITALNSLRGINISNATILL